VILAQASADPGSIEMPAVDWGGLSPLLVLVGGALLILTVTALGLRRPPRATWALLTVATGLGALVAAIVQWNRVDDDGAFGIVADALVVDGFGGVGRPAG
jgi:NADH-quinone oxidoreductase subunit N